MIHFAEKCNGFHSYPNIKKPELSVLDILRLLKRKSFQESMETSGKVCTISFERPVNYLCDAWHVFLPKYEAWTHFNWP